MKNLALIPIRSQSQRIKHKNIKLLAGHPLVYYQIECAKQVKGINKIVVTTDNEDYSEICKNLGVEVIWRPPEVSGPTSKTEEVMLYVINELEKKGEFYDNIVLLQATSPLNKPEYLQEGLDVMNTGKYNSVLTYCDFTRFLLTDETILSRPMSQKKVPLKLETGNFWITKISELKKAKNRIVAPYYMVKVSKLAGWLEIDDSEELLLFEALLGPKVREEENLYFKRREYNGDFEDYYGPKKDPDGVLRDITLEKDKKIDFFKDEISFINSLIKNNDKKLNFLDLGCGAGFVASAISDNYEKYGLEVSKKAADLAKTDIPHIHVGYLTKETYPEEFFDVVFCGHVIEHVEDPISFVRLINKIMKTHGHLIIGTPNFDSPVAKRFGENFRLLHDKSHISLFGEIGLRWLLEDNGFIVKKIEFPYFETPYFNKEDILKVFDTSKISPPFWGNIMTIYAQKK